MQFALIFKGNQYEKKISYAVCAVIVLFGFNGSNLCCSASSAA